MSAFSTTHVLRAATAESLEERIGTYFAGWPHAGYGTLVRSRFIDDAGQFCAEMWRANSCD